MGLGSLFNHSNLRQNVGWKRDIENQVIKYTALRDIAAGEELCISYGNARLWFKDVEADEINNIGRQGEDTDALYGGLGSSTRSELDASGLSRVAVDED